MDETMKYGIISDRTKEIADCIDSVYKALTEKGYDPVSQLVGYVLSGDPSYITGHMNARTLISRFERDELLEFLFKNYLNL